MALTGCGDDAGDAGGDEDLAGADQAQSADDPTGAPDTGRAQSAMDAGSDGMPAASLGGADLQSTTSVGPTCIDRPELVPDAGADACHACYLEHCCDNPDIFSCLVWPEGPCSDSGQFGRIQRCFAAERAADAAADSWDLVADCVLAERELFFDADSGASPNSGASPDSGELPIVWPWYEAPAIQLTRCIVGTLPVEDVPDGGIGPIREAFLDSPYSGWTAPDRDRYPAPSCAAECFEGWR